MGVGLKRKLLRDWPSLFPRPSERDSLRPPPFGIPSTTMLEDGGWIRHLQVSFPKELLGTEIQGVGAEMDVFMR